jgi:two-component system, OmpR family, sensor histidine kinase CiaH
MPDDASAPVTGDPESAAEAADGQLLRRVRVNLSLWSGGVTLAVLVALGLVLYLAVARSLAASGIAQLEERAGIITTVISGERPDPANLPGGGFDFGGPGSGTIAFILDAFGRPVGPGPGFTPRGLPVQEGVAAVAASGQRDVRTTTVRDTPIRVLTDPVAWRDQTLFVQVVGDRTTEQQTLTVLVIVLVIGGIVALLVASGAGAAYASRALVPIRRSLVSQRYALRRQREFAADASHELRTPLTVIRGSVEDLERHRDEPVATVGSALTDIRDEVDHMTAMVEDLLLLARSDSGAVALEQVPVDLGDVASDGASSLARLATERGVSVTVDPEPAEVGGDPSRLRQLVMILVDNAIRHSPTGGEVTVRVRVDGASARMTVDDHGAGITPEDLPRVFDRFYRAAGAPSGGTGLGLAIAAWIVERHGGRIAATNMSDSGARFTVELPVARPGTPTV